MKNELKDYAHYRYKNNTIVSLVIAGKLFVAYRSTMRKSHANFLLFYLFFGIFYATFATMQLFLLDDEGFRIGFFHALSYFFLYCAIGYLLSVPYQLTDRRGAARAVLWVVFLFNVLFLAARIVWLEPSVKVVLPAYVYWQPVFPEVLRVLTGIIAVATAAFVSSFFIRHGLKSRTQPVILYRSLWLGIGIAILMFAALLAFIAAPSGSAPFVVAATFLVLVGLLTTLRGVLYKIFDEHIA